MRLLLPCLLLIVTGIVQAHEVQHALTQSSATIITLRYSDDVSVAGAPYEIRPQGEADPVQMGWTDRDGRIAFAPRTPGSYRVSVFTADGHGVNLDVQVDASLTTAHAEAPLVERHARIVAGVGILFGLFGLLMLFYRRRPG